MKSKVLVSQSRTKWQNSIGMFAMVLFLTILIGSLILVLNLAHQSKNASASSSINSFRAVAPQVGVYVGSNDGTLFKLDAQNGSQLWRYKTKGNIIPASPTIVNGVVYLGSQEGFVYARNAADGSPTWS